MRAGTSAAGLGLSFACLLQLASGMPAGSMLGWEGEKKLDTELGYGIGKPQWHGEIIQLSWSPRAYLMKGFLSDEEIDHIISVAEPKMKKSTVVDAKTGGNVPSSIRTSTGTFFAQGRDAIVSRVEDRVAQVSMIPAENQEGMQILHYHDGEKYEPHWDYFNDPVNARPETGGQRIATVLMYLTTVEEGGETIFPNAEHKIHVPVGAPVSACASKGMSVKAIKGDAVMFFAMNPDGTVDKASLHGSCPTLKGDKWSATKWLHVGRFGFAPKPRVNDGDCTDTDVMCIRWAEQGECNANKTWMQHYCRKSCRVCKA